MFLPRNLHIVTFTTQPGQFAPCIANQPNGFVHKKPIKTKALSAQEEIHVIFTLVLGIRECYVFSWLNKWK